jgi:hypothetical protein
MQNLHNNFLTNENYLTPFFIGLFESHSTIHFRKAGGGKRAPYFLIRMKPCAENKLMLKSINQHLQLKASIYHRKGSAKNPSKIIMCGSSKYTFERLRLLFKTNSIGLLTSKKRAQFDVINQAKTHDLNTIRLLEKEAQKCIIQHQNQHFIKPTSTYFEPWLSGFLEPTIRFTEYYSNEFTVYFSILDDLYLMRVIKDYFQSDHKIVVSSNHKAQTLLYTLSMTNRSVIYTVITHFKAYPFLGSQQLVFNLFSEKWKQAPKRNQNPVPAVVPFSHLDLKNNYLEPFFVGLFEGDGTISFGRTKRGNLSYPFFQIKLKYNVENHAMLALIKKNIGGIIKYEKNKKDSDGICWVACSQPDVQRILSIFKTYPLLSSRKICQLAYSKRIMNNRSWNYHLEILDLRYVDQPKLILYNKQNFQIPDYFGP